MKLPIKFDRKTVTIIAIAVLVITVVFVWWLALKPSSDDTNKPASQDSSQSSDNNNDDKLEVPSDDNSKEDDPDGTKNEGDDKEPEVDLSSFSSLVITQLKIEVFYAKGIGGFSYQILRTPGGTQYIDFSSEDLIGTKCTDDKGVFASILKNPSAAEEATISASTKVESDSYGLSLPAATCTSEAELLAQYQAAFKSGFSSLRVAKDEQ